MPGAAGEYHPARVGARPEGERFHFEFGVAGEEPGDGPLVLLRGEGAGGVDDPAARGQHLDRLVQDLVLAGGTESHIPLTPLGDGRLVLAEHPLTGAGGVDDNPVKGGGEPRGEPGGALTGDEGVGDAHALDVAGEDLGPLGVDLVGHQQTLPSHQRCQVGGLPAWGGAEVQHPVPGAESGGLCHNHSAGLLDVVDAGVVPGVQPRAQVAAVTAAAGAPGHRLGGKGQRRIGRDPQQIQAQAAGGGFVIACEKGRILRAEQPLHTGEKGLGQGQENRLLISDRDSISSFEWKSKSGGGLV